MIKELDYQAKAFDELMEMCARGAAESAALVKSALTVLLRI